jgi:SAM-dependent methyltransferase
MLALVAPISLSNTVEGGYPLLKMTAKSFTRRGKCCRQRKSITPYKAFAVHYDALLGNHFYAQLRGVFEHLVRRYDIGATSAADVACGAGQFIRYLCQHGIPAVYGVDRSPAMLRMALSKNQGTQARFLQQEFATLQLPQPVDLITCNFDSLNYLLTADDLLCAFRRFHANLVRGGHVIFDMVTDRPWWQGSRPFTERITHPNFHFVRRSHWDPRRCRQTAVITITRNGRTEREVHVERGYPPALVVQLLAQTGLTSLGTHDFQTLGRPQRSSSRVVYVARKETVEQ